MKKLTTLLVLSMALFLVNCPKEDSNDDENLLVAALVLSSSSANCTVTIGSTTASIPFITATTTAQKVSFLNSNGASLGAVVAKNLAVGQRIVFTGSATATAYENASSSGCTIGATTSSFTSGSSPVFTQTSTNPPIFTVNIAQANTGIIVSSTSGADVTVKIE